jgi:PAS domain S-box-containing protein
MVGEEDRFVKQCKDAYEYMASLVRRADQGEVVPHDEMISQLSSVVEELSVTGEELSQQAEELRVTRDELAVQRQHYQDLFDSAPDGYLVTDKDGNIAECNLAGADMLNVDRKYVVGKPLSVFVAGVDQKLFSKRLDDLINNKDAGADNWELVMQPRNRTAFQALIIAKVMQESKGAGKLRWLIHDISKRHELEEQRRWLLGRLVSAHEEERTRIARELHDKMAQHLSALVMGLQSLRKIGQKPVPVQEIERLQGIAEEIGREVRQIATELRPAALDDLGLVKALSNYVQEWSAQSGVPVSFHQSGFGHGEPSLSSQIKTAVYRIVQQALINIAQHAKAGHVSVVLEQRIDHLLVIIEDDGVGFVVDDVMRRGSTRGALGLIGMRERAALLGGTLEIESKLKAGTTVFVRIPVSDDKKKVTEG